MIDSREKQQDPGIHLWVGFNGLTLDEELKYIIHDFKIGGIVVFKRNVQNPHQLRILLRDAQAFSQESLGRGLCVAIDHEGGKVQRLLPPFTRLPAARYLALEGSEVIREWTSKAAAELREAGIHINLAPVLDIVPPGKSSFMEERSLGSDPETVAALGKIWLKTLQENGISATAKHYPGLGLAELDPHHFAPVIHWHDSEAMERDLQPFQEAIKSGVHCVMTSHALYPFLDPVWPATLSSEVCYEWLRKRLGFEGVLLSDDMDMAAIRRKYTWQEMSVRGLLASVDIFLVCQHSENIEPFYRAIRDAVVQDSALRDSRAASLRRIERLFTRHMLG